ncbi:MAG: hypothetical protein LBM59_02835 [Ruminococcus sp.]|jgi:hypothetical protein|nr:hypothetical protein [Ruminococcus sp.]
MSIGTLNEKSVHAYLKKRFEEHTDSHEIKVGRYVADIVGEHGIIEIQTGAFEKLNKKLEAFLAATEVTVVYPVIVKTTIINAETGRRYSSPKKQNIYSFLNEAYKIREHLQNVNLKFILVLLTVTEIRSGKGRTAVKISKTPEGILEEIRLNELSDWHIFTDSLPETFTQADFFSHTKLNRRDAWCGLTALISAGLINEIGKKGNTKLYRIC